jgi:hypothetical protein
MRTSLFTLLRVACLLFPITRTVFGQDAQFSDRVNFGSFPKHAFNTVQGEVHITLHGFVANSATDWAMAVNAGNKANVTVAQATIGNAPFVNNRGAPPRIPPMKTVLDMRKWKDVRVSDSLIEINNLDVLHYQALAISLSVPAGTHIIVQNDDRELYSGRVEKGLMVKNGYELPNFPNDRTIANVLVPLMLP